MVDDLNHIARIELEPFCPPDKWEGMVDERIETVDGAERKMREELSEFAEMANEVARGSGVSAQEAASDLQRMIVSGTISLKEFAASFEQEPQEEKPIKKTNRQESFGKLFKPHGKRW